MKIKVFLCKSYRDCKYYLNQLATNPTYEHRKYRISQHFLEAANDDERILFITPDNPTKIMGLKIESYYLARNFYEHERAYDFLELVKTRIRTQNE